MIMDDTLALEFAPDGNVTQDSDSSETLESSEKRTLYGYNKELVILNGRINEMDRNTLVTNLKRLNLNFNGNVTAMKKRLKNYYKSQKLPSSNLRCVNKMYPYYVVVDFEATCNEINPPNYQHEIIEFPAVLIDSQKQMIVDEFRSFCKPKVNPILTKFCTELTGITQETVNEAEDFILVLKKFELWLQKHKLGSKNKFAFVTDGPWDMCRFLHLQCKISQIQFPYYAKKWINLRKTYSRFYRTKKMRLECMLEELGVQFEGRPHCGLDDAKNIANLLILMIKDGVSIEVNEHIRRMRTNYYYWQKSNVISDGDVHDGSIIHNETNCAEVDKNYNNNENEKSEKNEANEDGAEVK
ncbi:3'-5' exoribonuclease 1-like [Lycorma delicatula]|uniref:3'-5' exoribonuclease 1-like n=1 Tax=Lycorma delicatula TaxID=130591 RepID=UPI003F518F2A